MILSQVKGTRFTDSYLSARHGARHDPYGSPYRPRTTPAGPVTTAVAAAPHKVVSDFAAFSAPKASVFGTAVQPSPFSLAGQKAAFGGVRAGPAGFNADDDEDEDDDASRPRIGVREDAITYDQVRFGRIAALPN